MCADAGELGRGDADRRYDALTLNNEEGLANAHPEASLGRAVWPSRRQVWSPAGRRPMTRVVAASNHGHAAQAREVRRGEGRREARQPAASSGGRRRKPGEARDRSKKGTGGLALLAGAAGLAVKNRDKLMSMIRRTGSAHEAAHPVESQPVPRSPRRTPPAPRWAPPITRPPEGEPFVDALSSCSFSS
jgi:hypothetical protein